VARAAPQQEGLVAHRAQEPVEERAERLVLGVSAVGPVPVAAVAARVAERAEREVEHEVRCLGFWEVIRLAGAERPKEGVSRDGSKVDTSIHARPSAGR